MNERMRIKKYLAAVIRRAVPQGTMVGFNIPLNMAIADRGVIRLVRIQSLTEESQDRDESPRIYKRTFGITIECSYMPWEFNGQEADETAFEDFLELVFGAVVADDRLTEPSILASIQSEPIGIEKSVFEGLEYRTEPDAERAIYVGLMRFQFIYNVETGPQEPQGSADSFRATVAPGPV